MGRGHPAPSQGVHSSSLDMHYFSFTLDEEENVISEQLELDIILEPALSCLSFVVDLEVFILRRIFFYRFPKQGEENKRKTNWCRHVLSWAMPAPSQIRISPKKPPLNLSYSQVIKTNPNP